MIGNFKINTFTKDELIILGYSVMILKWDDIPESELFTSNLTGLRYLTSLGNSADFEILVRYIDSEDVTNYTKLNGSVIEFKKDVDDTIFYTCNCEVLPQRLDGKSFFNAVLFKLTTVESHHETSTRLAAIDPIKVYDEGQEFLLCYYDSDGNQGLINRDKKKDKIYILGLNDENLVTPDNQIILGV